MAKHVRHIWAKANQHIKVHRQSPRPTNDKNDNTIFIVIAIVVFIWICS